MSLLFNRPKIISYITLFFAMHTLWIYSMKQNETLHVFGGNMFSTVAALIATIALFITYFQNPQIGKPFWLLLALGSGSFLIGDLVRIYHECILHNVVPFPGYRDVLLMVQSIMTLTALFYLFFKHKGYYQFITFVFDIILLIIVIGTISWGGQFDLGFWVLQSAMGEFSWNPYVRDDWEAFFRNIQ